MSTETADVLNRAADLIQQRGWVVGGGWPETREASSPLCLEGGIMAALGITTMDDAGRGADSVLLACPAYQAVYDYLEPQIAANRFSDRVYCWNDTEGRTATEVIGVLRAVAVIEAARDTQRSVVSA